MRGAGPRARDHKEVISTFCGPAGFFGASFGELRAVEGVGGLSAPKALAILLGLELKGIVKQTEGKRFHLV